MDYECRLISIVMPIYNTERYLDACIKSVINQTYQSWELILIDDGSTDNSADVCNRWLNEDKRVRLYQHKNHGVSYTRNFGLSIAKGEFVIFIDSDDIVHSNFVQRLIELNSKFNSDLTMVSFLPFTEETETDPFSFNQRECKQVTFENDIERAFFSISQGTICSKMYRLDIIRKNQIMFDEHISVSEDLLFNSTYADYCKNAVYENSKLYGYRQRLSSAVHNSKSVKWFSCLDVYSILYNRYKDSAAFSSIIYYYLKNLYEAKYIIRKQHLDQTKVRPSLNREIRFLEVEARNLSVNQKVRLLICKYFFGLIEMRRNKI